VELIVNGEGTHFDPAVVDAFLRTASLLSKVAHESTDTAFTAASAMHRPRKTEITAQETDHSSAVR